MWVIITFLSMVRGDVKITPQTSNFFQMDSGIYFKYNSFANIHVNVVLTNHINIRKTFEIREKKNHKDKNTRI